MRRSRMNARMSCGWALALLATIVLVDPLSCGKSGPARVAKLTDTYKNRETLDPATNLSIQVTIIDSGATFPNVKAGSWVPAAPTITNVAPDIWRLDFAVNVPNGGSVTVGGEFASPQPIKDYPSYHFSNAGEPLGGSPGLPGIGMLVRIDPVDGLVLEVGNAASAALGDVVLQELEWTASDTLLPLGDLVYGNANLEALPWQSAGGSLPVTLSPGGSPAVFDIPEPDLQEAGAYVYLRYRTTTPSLSPDVQVEGVSQGPNSAAVPVLPGGGLLFLVFLVLVSAVRVLAYRGPAPGASASP